MVNLGLGCDAERCESPPPTNVMMLPEKRKNNVQKSFNVYVCERGDSAVSLSNLRIITTYTNISYSNYPAPR